MWIALLVIVCLSILSGFVAAAMKLEGSGALCFGFVVGPIIGVIAAVVEKLL